MPSVTAATVSLADKIRRWRVHRSGLAGNGFQTPDQVAIALIGVQAQDNVAALISIWNRLQSGAHSCDHNDGDSIKTWTETEIFQNGRKLVKIWGQRGTLHLYHIDDWPLIVACVKDHLNSQRLDRVDDPDLVNERVRRIAADLLANGPEFSYTDRHDPMTSRSIRMLLTLGGYGAWPIGRQVNRITSMRPRQSWTSTAWQVPALDDAVRRVALRYFTTYGPATEQDFRHMMGLRAGPSRRAVNSLLTDGDLITINDQDLLLPAVLRQEWDRFQPDPVPLRMLYMYDPIVLAHSKKNWLMDDEYRAQIWTRNGIVHGVVLVDGHVIGRWTIPRPIRRDGIRFGVLIFNREMNNIDQDEIDWDL